MESSGSRIVEMTASPCPWEWKRTHSPGCSCRSADSWLVSWHRTPILYVQCSKAIAASATGVIIALLDSIHSWSSIALSRTRFRKAVAILSWIFPSTGSVPRKQVFTQFCVFVLGSLMIRVFGLQLPFKPVVQPNSRSLSPS